jgi:hypothetical protein
MAITPEEQNLLIEVSHWLLKLEATINEMCLQIPGFFGRMDVMYNTFEELENGKNFAVVG